MQFTIAATPRASVEPSGSPSTARTWFSNWLVTAPSIVQCPELCTRGAISFASSAPPTSNSSTARTPTWSSSSSSAVAIASASRLQRGVDDGRRRAGEVQDAVAVLVLDDGPARDRAVEPTYRDDRQLAVERHERLDDQWQTAERGPRGVDVGVGAEHRLALAVVAAAAGLQHGRQPECGDRVVEVLALVDRAEGGVAMPSAPNVSFSRGGPATPPTGGRRAAPGAVPPGTELHSRARPPTRR